MDFVAVIAGVAAKYGAQALIKALGGSEVQSSAGGELAAALLRSEAQVAAQLNQLEGMLDEVLEQRFTVEMASGSRLLTDALSGAANRRLQQVELARSHFIQAASAARSSLQRAHAERQLLVAALVLGDIDGVTRAIPRVEHAAMCGVLESHIIPYSSNDAVLRLMRREGVSARGFGSTARQQLALRRVLENTYTAVEVYKAFLRETAALAGGVGLPVRSLDVLRPLGPKFDPKWTTYWNVVSQPAAPGRVGGISVDFRWPVSLESGRRLPHLAELRLDVAWGRDLKAEVLYIRPWAGLRNVAKLLVPAGTMSATVQLPPAASDEYSSVWMKVGLPFTRERAEMLEGVRFVGNCL